MPNKYDEAIKAEAMRLVRDQAEDYSSEWEAIKTVSGRLGMNPETLRKWLRQTEVDAGSREGVTTAAAQQIRELKRKNAELEQTIEILKAATTNNNRNPPPTQPRSPEIRRAPPEPDNRNCSGGFG